MWGEHMERFKHVVQINIVLGAWLLMAPFVMGYSGSSVELATDVVLGLWFIGCSWWLLAADSGQVAAAILQFIAGIALTAAPFVSHDPRLSRPFDNDVAVGILSIVVTAAAASMLARRRTTA